MKTRINHTLDIIGFNSQTISHIDTLVTVSEEDLPGIYELATGRDSPEGEKN